MQHLDYGAIRMRLAGRSAATLASYLQQELPQQLSDMWIGAYTTSFGDARIVSIQLKAFEYLFDLSAERNVAAWGVMGGKNTARRDSARMAGHPKSGGSAYHRGHMIPHSGHGGTDINLFMQLGSINVGEFRRLERLAVDNPGSFYFVRLIYSGGSQTPQAVEQGLLLLADTPTLDVRVFSNQPR